MVEARIQLALENCGICDSQIVYTDIAGGGGRRHWVTDLQEAVCLFEDL